MAPKIKKSDTPDLRNYIKVSVKMPACVLVGVPDPVHKRAK